MTKKGETVKISAPLSEFIKKMKTAKTCELASQYVDQLLTTKSVDELVKILVELAASKAINDETLGYYVFPGLQRMLKKKDKALLKEIHKLIEKSKLPEKFIMHCIMLLANYYRKEDGAIAPPEFVKFICTLSTTKGIPSSVRAQMARLLTRFPEKDRQDTLKQLIASKNMQLIDAACHTIARWSTVAYSEHQDLIETLLAHVERSPQEALKYPQLMRTVARIDHPRVDAIIDKIIGQKKSKKDIIRLAACLAPGRSVSQLAKIVGIAKKSGPDGRLAIRHLISREPALLDLLYQGAHYQEVVEVVKADPTRFGKAAIKYLDDIKKLKRGKAGKEAKALEYEIKSARYNAFLSREHLRERTSRSIAERAAQPGSTRYGTHEPPIRAEYSTGFNMGDALYRDTYLIDPFCHNHWHAGIFQAFELFATDTSVTGTMRGVHMTGFPGAVVQFTPPPSDAFASPACEVAVAIEQLKAEFMEAFKVNPTHPLRGIRRTPTMSKSDRLNLLETSEDLTHRSIYYTFADMLDWHGSHWSGAVDDIDNLRCDGVVEYVYEACGKKVCAGTQAANWNIAAPGNQHPESHADLHTWGLNDGELCPKVQAGAEGNDTTFIPTQPSAPEVAEFTIHEETRPTDKVVVIKFNIKSDDYYSVYVRILVGVEGGPFDFAVTAPIEDVGLAGKWNFKEVDEGMSHFAYWSQHTQIPNPAGNATPLEFRLVAVDKGGNVSAEYVSRLPLN